MTLPPAAIARRSHLVRSRDEGRPNWGRIVENEDPARLNLDEKAFPEAWARPRLRGCRRGPDPRLDPEVARVQGIPPTRRVSWRALCKALAGSAALAVVLAGQTMAADPDPVYRADVTPGAAAAGRPVSFTVSITHLAPTSRELGSLRITPPSGIVLTSASGRRGSNVLPVSVAGNRVIVDTANLNDDRETASLNIQADVPVGCRVVAPGRSRRSRTMPSRTGGPCSRWNPPAR